GVVAHLGLPGLLAAGLRSAFHASADRRGQDSRYLGAQAARFRARNKVAVQQYKFRDRRVDRREGERDAAFGLSQQENFRTAWDEERDQYRPEPANGD